MTALLSGVLLFLPKAALAFLGLAEIANKYRGWLFLAFAGSVLLLVTDPIESQWRLRVAKRRLRSQLRNLSGHEANLVRRCLLSDGRATNLIADHGTARVLEQKGILWCSTNWGEAGRSGYGFNITDAAYTVLREPEFISLFTPEKASE